MKKFFYMAVAAIAALSSCSNDNDILESINGNNKGEAKVFTGIIEGDATTRTTISDGTAGKKKVNWEATDEISINGVTYTTTPNATDATMATFAKKTASDADPIATYKAYYPATMASGTGSSVTFSLPATYTYEAGKFNMPMYTQSVTTELGFQNICGVLAINVTSAEMSKVTKITVTSDKAISGACTIALSGEKYAATATGTADADKTVTLDCGTGVTPTAEGTSFYLPVPVISDAKLSISVAGTINSTKAASYAPFLYRQAMNANGVTIERNKIYNINFTTSLAKFTVKAAEGETPAKTVKFTKGNLQATYNGSTYTWGFAANQWDYVGGKNSSGEGTETGNNKIASQASGAVVDLFGWSTSSTNYGINTSENNSTYSGDFKEWGENFPGKYYYTLSKDEWTYLLYTRTVNGHTGDGYSYKRITLTLSDNSTVYGLLIAPDGYTNSIHTATTWNEWENTLKPNGVVFLPAAGTRHGSNVSNAGKSGYCWSSSAYADDPAFAYNMYFYSSNFSPAFSVNRHLGRSVRLVSVASE